MPTLPSPFIKDIFRIYSKRKRRPRIGRVEFFFRLNIDEVADVSRSVVSCCINDVYSAAKRSSGVLSFDLVRAGSCKKLIYRP